MTQSRARKTTTDTPAQPAPQAGYAGADATAAPTGASLPDAAAEETQLRWDDTAMATHFANVVNIQSTREQVDLFFGTNQTWNVSSSQTLAIELSNRVILSPYAAKRLSLALAGVLREYEQRYGRLEV